jgi:ABC-type lipoprotein export system ATPase subunit
VIKSPVSDQEIESFLRLFNGDTEQAAKVLRNYDLQKKHVQRKQVQVEATGPILVRLQDVTKSYKVGRQTIEALRGISLDIHQGEFVALTGASGSGKSTLLQLIGGLDKPTDGIVEVDGANLKKMRDGKLSKFRNQTIGFVFQFFYLQPFLKVGTNLEVPGMFARTKKAERREQSNILAEAVGISDRMKHLPRELSGGQMQRAAIARALLNKPKLLLADEPTGNLDSVNGKAIIDLFETIRREYNTTIIVVTHDPAIAVRADREITLKDGEIV